MSRPKRIDPAVRELLDRVARTGLADKDVHERAGLPSGWLSQARSGRYGPDASSVKKLRRWLERFEAGNKEPANETPASTPSVAEVASAVAASQKASSDLLAAIRAAKSFDALDSLIEQIMLGVAEGRIEKGVGGVLIEAARERRQLLKVSQLEKAMQDLTKKARLLSQQEAQWITDMRAARTPAAVAPDQAVPPPPPAGPSSPT